MSVRLTAGHNQRDPLTGLVVVLGQVRICLDGKIRVTQITGAPTGTYNDQPGTSPIVPLPPSDPSEPVPGVPYGFVVAPSMGPLR